MQTEIDRQIERPRVFFDIEIGKASQGRIVFELVSFLILDMPPTLLIYICSTMMVSLFCPPDLPPNSDHDSCSENGRKLPRPVYRRER